MQATIHPTQNHEDTSPVPMFIIDSKFVSLHISDNTTIEILISEVQDALRRHQVDFTLPVLQHFEIVSGDDSDGLVFDYNEHAGFCITMQLPCGSGGITVSYIEPSTARRLYNCVLRMLLQVQQVET